MKRAEALSLHGQKCGIFVEAGPVQTRELTDHCAVTSPGPSEAQAVEA